MCQHSAYPVVTIDVEERYVERFNVDISPVVKLKVIISKTSHYKKCYIYNYDKY